MMFPLSATIATLEICIQHPLSIHQQAKKIIKKYKNLKRKKKYAGYKNAEKSKDDDAVFLKQVLLQPRQRLARMDKQDKKDVEFIKWAPLYPRQRLIRKSKKI